MWKKAVMLSILGYLLGVAIGVIVFLSSSEGSLAKSIPYILLSGIPGCVAMGSTVVYDIEKWSVARATVTHFLITFLCFYLLAFALGWFRFGDSLFWTITAAMVAGYIIIWLIQYLIYKRQIRKMNDNLQKRKSGWKAE